MARATHSSSPRTNIATWAALCLGLAAGAFAEGLHFSLLEKDLDAFAGVVNLGFLAPLVLFGATALTAALGAWRSLGWMPRPSAREGFRAMRAWAYGDLPERLADRSATILAVLGCAAVYFAGSFAVGSQILGAVARPEMGLGLILGVQLVLLAVCIGGFAGVFWLFRTPLRLAARRLPRIFVAPAALLGVGAVGGVVGAAIVAATDVGELLPWHVVSAAVAGVVGGILGWLIARKAPVAVATISAIVVTASFAATVWMPDGLRTNRALFTGLSPIASPIYTALEPRLDLDGDGSIHLLGGRDCAPLDASSYPGALEIINNGIDEDCSGADLTNELQIEEAAVSYGKPKAVKGRPHVFLITTDSLSMNHTSLGRTDRDTTPQLAKMAGEAVVFDNAFALAPSTRLALPGLLAGIFNSQNPLTASGGQPFGWQKTSPTLALALKGSGYRTVQVMSNRYFTGRWRSGPSLGFDVRDAAATKKPKDPVHTAPEVTDRVLAQIARAAKEKKPTFLWAHYYDHHHPFKQPAEGVVYGESDADVFDAELNFADHHWGRIFEALEATFEPHEYVIVFSSDHGEAFDEFHPRKHHGYDLRNPVLHVPLIIRAPGAPARRIAGLATHADVAPTVADIAGIARNPAWIGESLVPVLYEGAAPRKSVVYGLFYVPERVKSGRDPFAQLSVRTAELYYEADYDSDSERLTQWTTDPVGKENLSKSHPADAELMRHLAALKLRDLRASERALRGTDYDKSKNSESSKEDANADDAPIPAAKKAKKKNRHEDDKRP